MDTETTVATPEPTPAAPAGPQGFETTQGRAQAIVDKAFENEPVEGLDPTPPPETQTPEPTPEPAPTPEPEAFEIDIGGEKYKGTREERDYLIRLGLEAYAKAMDARAQPQAPKPQAQPARQAPTQAHAQPGASPELDAIRRELEELKGWKSQADAEREKALKAEEAKEMVRGAETAMGKIDFFKGHADDKEVSSWFKTQVMILQYNNPDMSYDTAAKTIANLHDKVSKKEKDRYVKDKVKAATTAIDKGGETPGPQSYKPNRHSLFDGTSLKRALAVFSNHQKED